MYTDLVTDWPIAVNEHFNFTIEIEFPSINDFYGDLVVEVSYENYESVKVCSVVPVFSGKNFPCTKCLPNIVDDSVSGTFRWESEIYQNNIINYDERLTDDINVIR